MTNQVQRFIAWIGKKIYLHFERKAVPDFQEHEIWWASLGENVGSEINGKNPFFERPVIVVRKFSNDMLFVVPSTTKLKNGTWYFPYRINGQDLRAVLAQARTISARRLLRKSGYMDMADFLALKKALCLLLTKTNPPDIAGGFSDSIPCETERTM